VNERRLRLGSSTNCNLSALVGRVVVVGELVGYARTSCGVDTGSTSVIVRRLTDGRQLSAHAATTNPLGPESFDHVDSIVMTRAGAVAWIAEGNSLVALHARDVEVHSADAAGSFLLDSGSAIQTGSLALHGSRLSWRHASATRSATLR
jgi:hypothetical protein